MGMCLRAFSVLLLAFVAYFLYIMFRGAPMPQVDPNPWWKKGKAQADSTAIHPFRVKIMENDLIDLKQRLALPLIVTPPLENANFTYGVNTDTLKQVVKYWKEKYNWREREARLNSVNHYKTQIEGLDIHFIRITPKNVPTNVIVRPLLLLHGWPGSVVEFYDLFPLLTQPQKDSNVVFEVIAPSLPGFGFSEGSEKMGLCPLHISQIFYKLMKRLNFDQFYIQGGDWGSIITETMATMYQEEVLGAHVNMFLISHPWTNFKYFAGSILPSGWIMNPLKEQMFYPMQKFFAFLLRETGYSHLQATKPDTLGIGLTNSPVGLAAYILEKFSTATNRGNPEKPDGGLLTNYPISMDAILDNIHVYWFTHSMTTSMRLYAEHPQTLSLRLDEIPSAVPFGVSSFRYDVVLPESFVTIKFPNLVFYREHNHGGHFAAMECPDALADDFITFVNRVEKKRNPGKTEL